MEGEVQSLKSRVSKDLGKSNEECTSQTVSHYSTAGRPRGETRSLVTGPLNETRRWKGCSNQSLTQGKGSVVGTTASKSTEDLGKYLHRLRKSIHQLLASTNGAEEVIRTNTGFCDSTLVIWTNMCHKQVTPQSTSYASDLLEVEWRMKWPL